MKNVLGIGLLGLTLFLSGCGDSGNKDTTKPEVSLSPISTVTAAGTVNIQATAKDNVAIKAVEFYDNGQFVKSVSEPSSTNTYTTTVSYTRDNNSTHTIKAIAIDTSGNKQETTTAFVVNIPAVNPNPTTDTKIPEVSLDLNPTSINSNTWTSLTVTVKATDDVAVSSVKTSVTALGITIDLGTAQPSSDSTYTLVITPESLKKASPEAYNALALLAQIDITVTATDTSGNHNSVTKTLTITH